LRFDIKAHNESASDAGSIMALSAGDEFALDENELISI
jgi:hypothetical protein